MESIDKFVCVRCGEVIDYDEILWEIEDTGEKCGYCPYCKGDLADACACDMCGNLFDPDTLINGMCDDCLNKSLTIESFRKFAVADFKEDECSLIEEFMLTMYYEFKPEDVPSASTPAFRELLLDEYQRFANSDLRGELERKIRIFVKRLYWGEWADYLFEKGGV